MLEIKFLIHEHASTCLYVCHIYLKKILDSLIVPNKQPNKYNLAPYMAPHIYPCEKPQELAMKCCN